MSDEKYVVAKANRLFGLAFDGDADRCLAVDETGKIVNGDFIMLICANELKKQGKLKDDTLVTVMNNMGLMIGQNKTGSNSSRLKVGDRYVLENMLQNDYVIGGEQSGHVIC